MVAREIAADVQRNLGGEGGEPARLGIHVGCAVVPAGDDEGRHLDVYAVRDGMFDRLPYRPEIAADPAVEILLPALEVNIHRVDVRQETRTRRGADRAVRDEDDRKIRRVQERGCVHDVLEAQQRLVVGECDADVAGGAAAEFPRERGKACRRDVLRCSRCVCHCNGGILTEGAGEIAAETADGEDEAAGVKMVQRLLLDRVERERGKAAVVQRADRTRAVLARAAESRLARVQAAGMGAETADGTFISAVRGGACLRGIISICGCGAHLSGAVRR